MSCRLSSASISIEAFSPLTKNTSKLSFISMFSKEGVSLTETVTILDPFIFSFFWATAMEVRNKSVNRNEIFFDIFMIILYHKHTQNLFHFFLFRNRNILFL